MDEISLLPVIEALNRILERAILLDTERIGLAQSGGRILAQDIRAGFDLPPFDNSSMDGFALQGADRPTDGSTSVTLQVIGDIPAGALPTLKLQPGQAARIMTGAPLPVNADCVVPVEDTDFPHRGSQDLPRTVQVRHFPQPGENVRPHGQDAHAGETLLQAGRRLTPPDLAVLATLGKEQVVVRLQPRVAILSTGSELVKPGSPLKPGMIYESNSLMVGGLVEQAGGLVLNLGIAEDDPGIIRERLDQAVNAGVDLIITSAGVSVGVYDYTRHVIEENGQLDIWRVNMRPGKPLAFGNYRGIPVLGLPGNPVAAYVCSLVFVLPLIQRMLGLPITPRNLRKAALKHAVRSDGRESYLRAVASVEQTGWTVRLTTHQGSGNLLSIIRSNALLIVPAGVKSLPPGAVVDIWLLSDDDQTSNVYP